MVTGNSTNRSSEATDTAVRYDASVYHLSLAPQLIELASEVSISILGGYRKRPYKYLDGAFGKIF